MGKAGDGNPSKVKGQKKPSSRLGQPSGQGKFPQAIVGRSSFCDQQRAGLPSSAWAPWDLLCLHPSLSFGLQSPPWGMLSGPSSIVSISLRAWTETVAGAVLFKRLSLLV